MSKYTPWFPPRTRPTRPGVYQRKMSHGEVFAKGNGKHWIAARGSIEAAEAEVVKSHHQPELLSADRPWRGLKEPA